MREETLKLALLCLGLLALVQPGAIALANFDDPYGFMVDLAAWLSAFVGASPVIFGYLAWRGAFGLRGAAILSALILALALLVYAIQERYYAGLPPASPPPLGFFHLKRGFGFDDPPDVSPPHTPSLLLRPGNGRDKLGRGGVNDRAWGVMAKGSAAK